MRQISVIEDKIAKRVAAAVGGRREQLGLTLRELAARSGVSTSMISDIERGTKSPTISTLSALAGALAVPISALVDSATSAASRLHVVRASERVAVVDPASGATRDSFGPSLAGSKVEFLRYVVPAHAVAGPFAAHASGTIEHVHLAAGSIRVVLGTEAVILEAGDSCSCLADMPHSFDNQDGEIEALIYLVSESP
jgi:transcriptional regulator with XRE-family HTH domain